MEANERSNVEDELENNVYGSEDAGFDATTDDSESITTFEESTPSKNV